MDATSLIDTQRIEGAIQVSSLLQSLHSLKEEGYVVLEWEAYSPELHFLCWWSPLGQIHYSWDTQSYRMKGTAFAIIKPPFPATRKQLVELAGRMNCIFSELVLPEYIKTTLAMMR